MPGVLTLEAMFQAGSWLVRKTDEFASSMVLLKEALNVKCAGFVRPGQTLTVTAAIKRHADHLTTLSAEADAGGRTVACGRLVLERFNLAERFPLRAASDALLKKKMRAEFELLYAHSPDNVPVLPSHYRWIWIDRFTEFVGGRRAVALKTVSMADEPIDRRPTRPSSCVPASVLRAQAAQSIGRVWTSAQLKTFQFAGREVVLRTL